MTRRRKIEQTRRSATALTGEEAARSAAPFAVAAANEIARQFTTPLAPGLHVVATPIGNLADITLRALATLARADRILCEDTRHSRTLLAHYGIDRPLEAFHEHNEGEKLARVLELLAEGKAVALISDAGTPLVSDPGFKLVRAAGEAGHAVHGVPGPSAVMAALSISGLPTDTFLFAGFLPTREQARRARLEELAKVPATLVLYEAPGRLAATLADIAAVLGSREAAVARELTKRFEEVERGRPGDLATWAREGEIKGEIVILVGPPDASAAISDTDIETALDAALADMSLRDAARVVAEATGASRSRVYEIGLKRKART